MKILILIQCSNLGGMEHATLLLIKELVRMGFEVEVLSLNPVGEMGDLLEKEGVSIKGMEYRGLYGWRSFSQVWAALRASDADSMIMVGHNLMAMLALGFRWHRKRILFMHFHHCGVMPVMFWKLIYLVANLQFKAIIFPSAFLYREAYQIAPWIFPKAHIFRSSIATHQITDQSLRNESRDRLGLSKNFCYIGNAGWLIARKRWDVFLKVADLVAREIPDARFLIAGDGPERQSLEKLAINLGIADRIVWMGWLKDLNDFYRSLDVMLFNSDWDAMGRTPLEAMAHGIPTVASVLNGGLSEIINTPSVGVFLHDHDIPELARQIIKMLKDPEVARFYAVSGFNRIKDGASPETHAIQVLTALGVKLSPIQNGQ